jgi:hypothetical protein
MLVTRGLWTDGVNVRVAMATRELNVIGDKCTNGTTFAGSVVKPLKSDFGRPAARANVECALHVIEVGRQWDTAKDKRMESVGRCQGQHLTLTADVRKSQSSR